MSGRWIVTLVGTSLVLVVCAGEPEQAPPQQPPPPAVTPQSAPPGAEFAVALWPGEGIPEFDATGSALLLRTGPGADAAVHDTLRLAGGTRISYDSTSNRTVLAAPIAILRADTIAGRDFGEIRTLSRENYQANVPTVQRPVTATSSLHLLQHRAEGTCFVRLESRVIEADPCPMFDTGAFQPSGEPVTEWWIFVTGGAHGGGWVVVSDSTVRLAGRRF
jgi:hypothetical protein